MKTRITRAQRKADTRNYICRLVGVSRPALARRERAAELTALLLERALAL